MEPRLLDAESLPPRLGEIGDVTAFIADDNEVNLPHQPLSMRFEVVMEDIVTTRIGRREKVSSPDAASRMFHRLRAMQF